MEGQWDFRSAAVLPPSYCFFWLCACSWHSHFSFIEPKPSVQPVLHPQQGAGRWIYMDGEEKMPLQGYSKNSSLKQKRISCYALFLCCKEVGKIISSIEEDTSEQAEGKGAIRGLCWQCQLMGKMKMGFAPGSIVGPCHAFHFSCVPVWPHALQPE